MVLHELRPGGNQTFSSWHLSAPGEGIGVPAGKKAEARRDWMGPTEGCTVADVGPGLRTPNSVLFALHQVAGGVSGRTWPCSNYLD